MKLEFKSEDEVIDFIEKNKIVDDIIILEQEEETLGDLIVETEDGKLFRIHYSYLLDIEEYSYQWLNGVYEVERFKVDRYEYTEKEL